MENEAIASGQNVPASWEALASESEKLGEIADKTFYTGLFVDREELYEKAPASLENIIEYPHVTLKFAPSGMDINLGQLGEHAKITAVGYGNDGKNEGLLVKVETDDPVLQAAVDKVSVPHITLSFSSDSHAMYTSNLEFTPLEEPFEIEGTYSLHMKGQDGKEMGALVDNLEDLNKAI